MHCQHYPMSSVHQEDVGSGDETDLAPPPPGPAFDESSEEGSGDESSIHGSEMDTETVRGIEIVTGLLVHPSLPFPSDDFARHRQV